MKDLSLSLLSRGCGRFVSSDRLDVCFTPQDYYIWKSQDSLLRLSNSGRLLVKAESALPKTYSTRRGQLLLYSQDLVTMETSCLSETRDRKQRVVLTQQVGQQLSTVKELSAAILSYSNTKFNSSRLGQLFCPPLYLPLAPVLQRPSPPKKQQPSPELLVQSNPQGLPAERSAARLENQHEDKEGHGSRERIRLDLFLQLPRTSRTPSPQMEPQHWVHYVAMTPEEPEDPQPCTNLCLQHTESSTHAAIKHHSRGGELHHPVKYWVRNTADDQSCSIQDSGTTGDKGNYENSLSGNRHGRIGLLPPLTVGHSVCNGPCWEKTGRWRWEGPSSDEHHARRLPPIAESRTVDPDREIQAQSQQDAPPKAERHVIQSQGIQNRLHQQPLLFLGKEELPPVGVLGCVAGRKGNKQNSLAFSQNRLRDLQGPCESSNAIRGVVRGVLPLELRDFQNGKSVGSLILGPDGEIIRLSLYDTSSREPSHADGDTQEQAQQVLSAEGEKSPWVIVLQPEHTHTEGDVEGDVPVADIQHHQSLHKLSDLHTSTETNASSPSSQTHAVPAAVTKKKTKGAEAVAEMLGKDAKNSVRMPPLREQVGQEEPSGGNTEEEEEDEEETSHLSGQQNISPNEAATEDAVDKRRKNTKRKDTEDAAATTRKREMKPAKNEKTRTRREGRQRTKGDALSISRRKQEERTSRGTAETQALPPVKKKMTDGEEGSGEVPKQKEESAGRRGRLKHKKLVVGNHDDPLDKVETSIKKHSATQGHKKKTNAEDTDAERLSTNADQHNLVRSVSSLRSAAAASQVNRRSSRRSAASSCEEALPPDDMGPASSRGRLSSCSTVKVTEQQLMLNPAKPEFLIEKTQEEAAALRLAQRAERRRQEVERKRMEREEEERKQLEREQTEEKMKSELEEERRKRAEELRLKKLAEEEKRRRREEEERERARQEEAQREGEKRRQEERRQQVERLQRMREEEEQRRRAELERVRLEKERRQQEESKKLQEMDEGERMEYLSRKEQEEENRRKEEEDHKRREEEAALQAAEEAKLQAELLARQMALLQQQLAFKRGLVLEAEGLERTQGISRPWVYSYFTLLQLLKSKAVTMAPDL